MLQVNTPVLEGASIVTVTEDGVPLGAVPLDGLVWHQVWSVVAFQFRVELETGSDTVKVCPAGVLPPETPEKDIVEGLRLMEEAMVDWQTQQLLTGPGSGSPPKAALEQVMPPVAVW